MQVDVLLLLELKVHVLVVKSNTSLTVSENSGDLILGRVTPMQIDQKVNNLDFVETTEKSVCNTS